MSRFSYFAAMRRSVIPFANVAASLLIACAATQPAGSPEGVEQSDAVEDQAAPAVDAGSAGAKPSAQEAAEDGKAESESGSSSACPPNMKLVNGEYCSKVEHKCLKSWYDKVNKKTVCEEFEPVSKCVGEKTPKRFCIDTFAWPNKKGERPEVMNKFHQAQVKCAAVGKRLCTESEWNFACEGPEMKPFPHGYVRDTNKCHGDVLWDSPDMNKVARRNPEELARLWKGVRSGSQPGCVSDFGVADLPGNNDEIVASETFEAGWRGKFDSVHTGGPWYKGVRNQCRPKIYTHNEGFYYYFLGFRCCAEPDGKPTEPLTPKQKKANWKFERVERMAGFSVEQMQKMLELKSKQGHCDCKPGEWQWCHTMCGTLLGPNAKDAK
jgi:hypothetical protein